MKNAFARIVVRLLVLCGLLVGFVMVGEYAPRTETERLQRHFRNVDRQLLNRDISELTEQQRVARFRLISQLREYSAAGVFPQNRDFAERTPYFKDQGGVPCAMAYLIEQNGGAAFVERIATTNNNAYIKDLAADPVLLAWLDDNGLSLAEAALIQPAYEGGCACPGDTDMTYVAVSLVHYVAAGGSLTWTLLADSERAGVTPGVVSVGLGVLGVALGVSGNDDEKPLPAINVAVGAANALVGLAYIVRAKRTARSGASPAPASRWQPLLDARADGTTRIGVNLRM